MNSLKLFTNFIRSPFICYFDLGSSDPAPTADPAVAETAQKVSDTGDAALAASQATADENAARQAELDATASTTSATDTAISTNSAAQGDAMWEQYNSLFTDVEKQMVSDAMNVDSAGGLQTAADQAASGVQLQYANAYDQNKRSQAAMGINPNSARAQAINAQSQFDLAAKKAGAATSARQEARDTGIAARKDAANYGLNLATEADKAYSTATSAGDSAVKAEATAITTANDSASQLNDGYKTSIAADGTAAGAYNTQYGNQLESWNAQQKADATSSAGIGNVVGTIAGASAEPWWMASSKKIKEAKKPVDDDDTLKKVKDLPVDSWKYKDGEGDEGEHVGAYAEDVQKSFGNKAAPGGKAIDIISMHGITLSAVKGLSKQVDKLEKKVAHIAARGIRRA